MTKKEKFITFEFVALWFVTFVAFCNVTVFYNLFPYLGTLGIAVELRGIIVGAYFLTSMVLYLLASPYLNAANALRAMIVGTGIVVLCGFGYLIVNTFWGLVILRMVNGIGQFLLGAGATALFVSVIPKEKSAHAFALYSIAILLPYGAVPALMDLVNPHLPSVPYGYAALSITFLPTTYLFRRLQRRNLVRREREIETNFPPFWTVWQEVLHGRTSFLLLTNLSYMINWSSMFFLYKGFAEKNGIPNVGSFFSVQMAVMILIRLAMGRFFDAFPKGRLAAVTFAFIALGHTLFNHLPGSWAVPFIAILFGAGMGLGQPIINSLMFELSPPARRAQNANLLLAAGQTGAFFGPILGGIIVAHLGYEGYFLFSTLLALSTMVLCVKAF